MVVGITGGSGTGKSTICKIFEDYRFEIIDADAISKEIMNIDNDLKKKLVDTFGKEIIKENSFDADGNYDIDRRKLGSIVFKDKKKLNKLNELTHPAILAEIKRRIDNREPSKYILDAPLLIGTELENLCDYKISVTAPFETRIERIMNRDNISYSDAANRIASQHPDKYYIKNTDYNIYNDGDFEFTKEKIVSLIQEIVFS